jgi:hypothetical protein
MTPVEPVAHRRYGPAIGGYSILTIVLLVAAILLFLGVAFEVFHGKAINRAAWSGLACFAASFLPFW